ncbi:MAG: MarC family protein [Acidobacteriota bacterium]|nr:MarC family protein [Acidobacteriota bacterium]
MNTEFFIQSLISMLVITSVFDPVKILFFNQAIADPPRNRYAAAARVALYSVIVLGTTVLIGRQFLDIMGIRLDAFRVIGGLLIAIMGLEMLQGGGVSKSQGEGIRSKGPEEDDNLLIPLTLPLIAGPGAITTTITIAAHGDSFESVIAALLCVLIVGLVAFISYAWLGEIIGKAKPNTVSVLARIGGLLLATIGAQMLLGGLKDFFA